jgi:hypothetical protein
VKLAGAITAAMIAVFLLALIFSGGKHNPGRHFGSAGSHAARGAQ